jgi:hypothetical protein
MKIGKFLLVWLFAAACANASGSDAQSRQAAGFLPMDSERSSSNVSSRGSIVPKPNKIRRNLLLRANFPDTKVDVVGDMGATSTVVQQEATNTPAPDERLIVLAALGLIVLQLQRKHKSLLQRRLTPSS